MQLRDSGDHSLILESSVSQVIEAWIIEVELCLIHKVGDLCRDEPETASAGSHESDPQRMDGPCHRPGSNLYDWGISPDSVNCWNSADFNGVAEICSS